MIDWPSRYGRHVLESVDSTLDEAVRRLPVQGPEWILAKRQTRARGRRGRSWSMHIGNFAGTLILPVAEPPALVALRSFVASLALREACIAATGREDVFSLKWPNDVLLRGCKLAGILLERLDQDHLAIGIGVNLVAAPRPDQVEPGAVPPVALNTIGHKIAPEDFLNLLADAYARYEDQFTTFGFAPIRAAWLSHAARLGEVITARTNQVEMSGTFADVDETGQLVLETPKGRVTIPAADVYF
ncbi:MAG: biotin--[acetyl-CoA-carboxylase] ligase [Pseudomonadota bacterium]